MSGPFDDAMTDVQLPRSGNTALGLMRRERQLSARLAAAALGALLLFSPWLFGIAGDAATWSAWALGFAVLAIALATAADKARWPDRVLLAAGAAVVATPWAFGFAGETIAAVSHVGTGLGVILVISVYLSKVSAVATTPHRLGRWLPTFRQAS